MMFMFEPSRRYSDFSGRTSRRAFWLYQLVYFVVIAVLGGWIAAAAQLAPDSPVEHAGLGVMMIFLFGSFVPRVALTMRRLHDGGLPGSHYLWMLIPYVSWVVWFVFGCRSPDPYTNAWGAGPFDADEDDDIFR